MGRYSSPLCDKLRRIISIKGASRCSSQFGGGGGWLKASIIRSQPVLDCLLNLEELDLAHSGYRNRQLP